MGIELSVTVWERTFKEALTPAFFDTVRAATCDPFDEITVVINNVLDLPQVQDRAMKLKHAGVISRVIVAADVLPRALAVTGLHRRNLEPLPFYTDHFLVKFVEGACDYVVHWDTDAKQDCPADWVRAAVQLLKTQPRVFAVNPAWPHRPSIEALCLFSDDLFDYGFGFSDQAFAVRRADLCQPIYRSIAPATWWQPTSHLTPIFEQRIDAHMRTRRLFRAVYRDVAQFHDAPMAPQPSGTPLQRVRRRAQHEIHTALDRHVRIFRPRLVQEPRGRHVPEDLRQF